jgi:pimeloyl-ACP methyl ester carboxylesterase
MDGQRLPEVIMMEVKMPRLLRFSLAGLALACAIGPCVARGATRGVATKSHAAPPAPPQDTGFLNRKIELHGVTYRFQVYLPEEWRRDDGRQWPVILFLHGRSERGSEGMWQTQIGLPEAVRNHPDRWPFVIVMPQCPESAHWTDPAMLDLAMGALDQESAEFHGDAARTYLTGLSLGGYGAWELARLHPQRWAAIAIAAGGVFWSYEPERWQEATILPAEYARALGRTPVWLFHGSLDTVVSPRQSELMFDAFKAAGGDIRLWIYQGLPHDCWTRAYDEPELPRWLLAHRTPAGNETFAERILIPLRPPTINPTAAQFDSLTGEYREPNGKAITTIFRQSEQLLQKAPGGEVSALFAESPDAFYYPNGTNGVIIHLTFERDAQGRVTGYLYRDNRHEEHWVKIAGATGK